MVRMGLNRPGTIPFWTPSASDMAIPRGKVLPVVTHRAARAEETRSHAG